MSAPQPDTQGMAESGTPVPDDEEQVPRAGLSDAAHYATSVTVGAVALTWDRVTGSYAARWIPDRRWPHTAVGALFDGEDAAIAGLAEFERWARERRKLAIERREEARAGITDRLANLADEGAAQTALGRRAASAAATAVARRVATNSLVNSMVDAQLERVLRPMIAVVLDDVFSVLDADPDKVRNLIRDQRESITDEVVGRIRAGAVAGDTSVQGLVSRLLRSRRGSKPPTEATLDSEAPEAGTLMVAPDPAEPDAAPDPAMPTEPDLPAEPR